MLCHALLNTLRARYRGWKGWRVTNVTFSAHACTHACAACRCLHLRDILLRSQGRLKKQRFQ